MPVYRRLIPALIMLGCLLSVRPTMAANLVVNLGHEKTWTTEQLLARPDVATIEVPADVSFARTMTYRAVPLRALLVDSGDPKHASDEDLQITGKDGFVAHVPTVIVLKDGAKGAVPWLAIEPPGQPWPRTPGGQEVGPFYVVWLNPAASGVLSEQWPFQVASIRTVQTHALRWPQLAVGDEIPGNSPLRRGQTLFATQCMVCHRFNGAGDSSIGPDLNLPHNPTEYLQPWALKALIRSPESVRKWPDMKMPGFAPSLMSDGDLDDIVAYLAYMSKRR